MKQYSDEFKAEAVKRVLELEQNQIMAHVSRDLKIGVRTLAIWVAQARRGKLAGTFTFPSHRPIVLRTLDQIAREKQQDALFVIFHKIFHKSSEEQRGLSLVSHQREPYLPYDPRYIDTSCFDYVRCHERQLFVQWLYENNINFEECWGFGSVRTYRHKGQIYIDVPYDESNSQYQLISQYLENPDGSLKDPSIAWYVLKLEIATLYKDYVDPYD